MRTLGLPWIAALALAAVAGSACDCFPTMGDEYRCLRTSASTGAQDARTVCALSLDEARSLSCGAEFSTCTCTPRDDTGACVYKQAERSCR